MNKRIFGSAFAIAVYLIVRSTWAAFQTSIEAAAAVQQVKNSVIAYVFGQQMARGNLVPNALLLFLAVVLVMTWWKPIAQVLRGTKNGTTTVLGLLVVAGVLLNTGCMGPAKVLPLETVGPNETAFVIPMEGDSSNQAKFESIDFLKAHKVLAKRVEIPVRERDTGRGWWNYEYIPTVRVIKVDRSLVTREWTKGANTGTSNKDEALSVASLDGINFHIGVNLTASILEEDAPTYLYWHGQKTLAEVVDSNIRGYLQGIVSNEFGRIKLEAGKTQKADIFNKANTETIKKFKEVGITISYVGSAQGFMFDDTAIQNKINETQTAEMAVEVARKRVAEQIELNRVIVSKAVADRQAAEEFAKAAEAQAEKIGLDIEMVRAQAMLEAAKNLKDLKGQLPSVLPPGATLLFGLDGKPKTRD